MYIISGAILLSVLGAVALQKSSHEADHAMAYSVGGYIAFIISFALLEYGLISMPLSYTFGIWAIGNALLTTLVGWIFYHERPLMTKAISLVMVIGGLIGLVLS